MLCAAALVACSTAKTDTATTADSPGAASPTAAPTASPAAPTADPAEVRRAIEAANARYSEAAVRGDSIGVLANYADDAIVLWQDEDIWRGREAVAKGLGRWLSQARQTENKLTTLDVVVAGDLAVETGTGSATIQPKSGNARTEVGKYLTVWKRQSDGAWKIIRDSYNANAPRPQ